MKNSFLKLTILVFVCAMLAGCVNAEDISLKIVEKSGYFTAGYDPSSYHTYEGYGLAVDVIKFAAKRMGVEAPISPVNDYDWQVHLKNKDIDLMLCKYPEDEFLYVQAFTDKILLVSDNRSDVTKKIGVMDTDACIEQKNVLSYQGDYDFLYYSDFNLLFTDFESGYLDALIASEYDAMAQKTIDSYTVETLSESAIYFLADQSMHTFYNKLSQVLTQMASDGTIDRLKQEYYESLQSNE